MPKRRVPGHLQRTGRRRRDRAPNVPPVAPRPPTRPEAAEQPTGADAVAGRPLRPTLRAAAGPRLARTVQPALDLAEEYRYVVRDLRQIGVLALLAFLVLGALAVVIR